MKRKMLFLAILLPLVSAAAAVHAIEVTFIVQNKQATRGPNQGFQNSPLSGWCIIKDQAGREYYPVDLDIPGEEPPGYFYFWKNFKVDLKTGVPYTVRIDKGLGWDTFEETLTFQEGQNQVTVNLSRWIDLSNRRWLAGDLETRFKYMEPSLAMDAQGISLVCRVTQAATASSEVEKGAKGFHHLPDERGYTGRDWGFGEFNVLATLEELVVEDETPFQHTDLYHVRKGKRLAGFIDVVDPDSREVPVAAALGCADFVRVVGPEKSQDEIWDETRVLSRFEDYYLLLNGGFHLPVGAASLAEENRSSKHDRIGDSRVYARILGTFSLGGFLETLRKGPSWATNGPALTLVVNKKDTGMEYELPTPSKSQVHVSIGARSDRPIDRLELIHNGEVVETIPGSATQDFVLKNFMYRVKDAGWIAARVFEKPVEGESGIRYAHSSPVYLTMPEKPSYREDAVRELLDQVVELIDQVEANEEIAEEEKREILAMYGEAQTFYENRLKKIEELRESL